MLVLYANMQTGQTIKVTLFVDRNMNQLLGGWVKKKKKQEIHYAQHSHLEKRPSRIIS